MAEKPTTEKPKKTKKGKDKASKTTTCPKTECKEKDATPRIALVTGGNRGIGFEIVNGLSKNKNDLVIFTCRKAEDGAIALEKFKQLGKNNVVFRQLDLEDDRSIDSLITSVLEEYKYVDWLVNNAGIYLQSSSSTLSTNVADVMKQFQVNTLGPLRLIIGLVPAMKERNYGRIVNMSSHLAKFDEMTEGKVGYRISKAALNVLTRTFADDVKDKNILINSMSPGWVKTDMSGGEKSQATRTPAEGADTAIWLATLENDGPRGGFFYDRKPISW